MARRKGIAAARFPTHARPLGRDGAPEGNRTPNLLIRSQMLYPIELPAQPGEAHCATGPRSMQALPARVRVRARARARWAGRRQRSWTAAGIRDGNQRAGAATSGSDCGSDQRPGRDSAVPSLAAPVRAGVKPAPTKRNRRRRCESGTNKPDRKPLIGEGFTPSPRLGRRASEPNPHPEPPPDPVNAAVAGR